MNQEWTKERRGFYGTDKRTDASLIEDAYFSDSENLTLEQGVAKCRPGSILWGTLDFSSIAGTKRRIHSIECGDDTYILAHIGARLYYGKKTGVVPSVILDLAAAEEVVVDADSEFEDWGFSFGEGGEIMSRVLFKQDDDCLALEFNSASGAWTSMQPGIDNAPISIETRAQVEGYYADPGTYRVRVTALRVVNGVRMAVSAPTAKNGLGFDITGYQQIELTEEEERIYVDLSYTGSLDPQITHFMVEVTNTLDFTDSSLVSGNGNDPTLFYEADIVAVSASPISIATDLTALAIPTPNIWGFEVIPGHLISAFVDGVLWFGGFGSFPSRLYHSALTGYAYHAGLYDPTAFHPIDEGDARGITAILPISDHLGVWKPKKTGILPNRDPGSKFIFRDRKVGAKFRRCVSAISEDEIIVLSQDKILRLFNGLAYTSKKTIEDADVDLSDKMRSVTALIDPETVTFLWHKEKLHLLFGETGSREAIVLHPRERFGWMPWASLQHEWNAMVDDDNTWVYLASDGRLYEQSPPDASYLDRAADAIEWYFIPAPTRPKNRFAKIEMTQYLIEARFTSQPTAVFTTDAGRVVSDSVECVPDPTEAEQAYQTIFQFQPAQVTQGNSYAPRIDGTGEMILRAIFEKASEDPTTPGWTA